MPNPKPTIVPLNRSRLGDATELLADAFLDDPFAAYMIPDESQRRRGIKRMMGRCLSYGMLYGHVDTTENLDGVAAWVKPEYVKFNFMRMLRSGMIAIPWILGRAATRRFSQAMSDADRLHSKHAPGRHWYLFILAAGPNSQRRGVGTALMRHGLARIDAQGLPCFLETTAQKNVEYYPRHGFEMVETATVGDGPLGVWAFLRQPS